MIGRAEVEDAMKRLDKLPQEEARVVVVRNLKVIHLLTREGVANAVAAMDNGVADMIELLLSMIEWPMLTIG